MRAGFAAGLALLSVCAACAPASAWTVPEVISDALQWDAPAAAAADGRAVFAWTGFEADDVHQDARAFSGGVLEPAVTLPLPPDHPFDQRLIPGADGRVHLLWLDAGPEGGNHLYSALLAPDLSIERGPVDVSGAPVYRYAAASSANGGAAAVWSQGAASEPQLYTAEIDATGRALQPVALNLPGSTPALVENAAGALDLYWLHAGQLWQAALEDPTRVTAVSAAPGLHSGDRLEGIWAAPCGTLICVGWNLTRAGGPAEFWLSSGPGGSGWDPPARIPGVSRVSPGSSAVAGQPLRAGAQMDDGLSVVVLENGEISGVELAAPGRQTDGQPALLEVDGGLLLAWAELGDNSARLWLVKR